MISEDPNFRRQIDRPEMKEEDIKKVIGLQVRNLPPTLSDEDVVKFLAEHVDKDITVDRVSFMKTEQSINAAVESGLEGAKVVAAAKVIEFRQSKKKFFDKPLYCRILKNLTPEKVHQSPPSENNEPDPKKNLEFVQSKSEDASKQSVKDKTNVFENKVDEKKVKAKAHGQKIAEYGLTNTTAQQSKRAFNDVGSPTSPELKKSPKKCKAVDKNAKK